MLPDPGLFDFFPIVFGFLALVVAVGVIAVIVAVVKGGPGSGVPNSASSDTTGNAAMDAMRLHSEQQQREVQLQIQLNQQQIIQQQINQAAATPPPSGPPA